MGKNNLDAIRQEIQSKIELDRLANPEKHANSIAKMARELDKLPSKVIIDQLNYIDKNLLPAVKKKSGESSPDYQFFAGLIDSLLWALMLKDRFDLINRMYGSMCLELQITRDYAETFKRELDKYTTLEDLWCTESLEHVLKGMQNRAQNLKSK